MADKSAAVLRYRLEKSFNNIKISHIVIAAFVLIFLSVGGLVSLRLYALNLEYQLSRLEQKIAVQKEINLKLEKTLASLVSPGRVFDYARATLGMTTDSQLDIVRIKNNNVPVLLAKDADVSESPSQTSKDGSLIARLLNFVTKKAFAR